MPSLEQRIFALEERNRIADERATCEEHSAFCAGDQSIPVDICGCFPSSGSPLSVSVNPDLEEKVLPETKSPCCMKGNCTRRISKNSLSEFFRRVVELSPVESKFRNKGK